MSTCCFMQKQKENNRKRKQKKSKKYSIQIGVEAYGLLFTQLNAVLTFCKYTNREKLDPFVVCASSCLLIRKCVVVTPCFRVGFYNFLCNYL